MTTTRVAHPAAIYTTSTRSTSTGSCVEVAALPGGHRAVRDSKHPTGPTLTVTPAEWLAFTTTLRTGNLD